jgi:hypothetical protein
MHRQFARRRRQKEFVSGESAHKPSTHCAGKAWFRLPCVSPVHYVRICSARGLCGCQSAPGLPCALSSQRGRKREQGSGNAAARTRTRDYDVRATATTVRIEAAMPCLQTPSLRAQRSNPESFPQRQSGCFAALAMTMWRQCAPTLLSCAPDAAQRFFSGALLSRAHLAAEFGATGSRLCAAAQGRCSASGTRKQQSPSRIRNRHKTSQGKLWTVFIQRVNFSPNEKKNAGSETWLS